MTMLKLSIMAVAAGLAMAQSAHSAELLVNGSFDTPPGADPPGYTTYFAPGGFTGWTVTEGSVDLVPADGFYGGEPDLSSQLLDLVGEGSTGGIAQTFNTILGTNYTLSFFYSNNPFSTSTASAEVKLLTPTELLNDIVIHTGASPGNLNWTNYSFSFVGTGTPTTLSFRTLVGGNSGGVYLDNVSVATAAVPEPGTWAMMIGGFGMAGAVLRRRRAVAA